MFALLVFKAAEHQKIDFHWLPFLNFFYSFTKVMTSLQCGTLTNRLRQVLLTAQGSLGKATGRGAGATCSSCLPLGALQEGSPQLARHSNQQHEKERKSSTSNGGSSLVLQRTAVFLLHISTKVQTGGLLCLFPPLRPG